MPSSRATRIALLIVVPLALVFGVQAASWAVPKIWSQGETLTADDLNKNFQAVENVQARPWVECGTFESLRNGAKQCEINDFPIDAYEYGFKYNGPGVQTADCLFWNRGLRIVSAKPYLMGSDNPTNGAMQLGGAIFYTETDATDDDIPASCPSGMWRHHYWRINAGSVVLDVTNGCTNDKIYCRRR
jgi:hypothetical protein